MNNWASDYLKLAMSPRARTLLGGAIGAGIPLALGGLALAHSDSGSHTGIGEAPPDPNHHIDEHGHSHAFDKTPDVDPSRTSMSMRDAVAHRYENAPGGFAGAVERASQAATPEHGVKYDLSNSALDRKVPLSFKDLSSLGGREGGPWGVYVPDHDKMTLDSNHGRPHFVAEHETTHSWQHGPVKSRFPGLFGTGQPKEPLNDVLTHEQSRPNFGPEKGDRMDYLRNTAEFDARIAEMKRMYVHAHPGIDVNSPEEAERAIKWNSEKATMYKTSPFEAMKVDGDVNEYMKDPNWPKLKEYILKRMPGMVHTDSASPVKAAHWATEYLRGS